MVCLLCYESNNGDYIALTSGESEHLNISCVLFKYFKFMFEVFAIYICIESKNEITSKLAAYITILLLFETIFRLSLRKGEYAASVGWKCRFETNKQHFHIFTSISK